MKAGIIGAGIGGLATAIRLAVKGYEVDVFEKNPSAGGKMSELRMEGFRFDTGPSLFTLPELTNELFELCGENRQEWLPLRRLETNCKYFFPDGTVFNFYHDRQKVAAELTEHTQEKPENLFARLDRSKEVYELSAPVFLFNTFGKWSDFRTPPYRKIAGKLYKLDFFRTMHRANRQDFSDAHLVQLFDRYATYNGSNPYRAPATLNMIAHLENNIGAFFPENGMYAIVVALYRLALKKKVRFHFDTLVESIETAGGKVSGLRAEGRFYPFDVVVSDADVNRVASSLLPDHPLKKRLRKAERSSSALIFYWGMRRRFEELEIHNIFFSDDYKKEFDALFKQKTVAADPTIYVFISSKMVPEDAPAGCENWFVMVNAPADAGQDWDELIEQTRRRTIERLSSCLKTDLRPLIGAEETASPLTIERNTLSSQGALYGMSSNSMFSAFLRHPNSLKKIAGLYFVGGSVHPGGGIPLCLASARIVDTQIPACHD